MGSALKWAAFALAAAGGGGIAWGAVSSSASAVGAIDTIAPANAALVAPGSASTLPIVVMFSGAVDAQSAAVTVELWYRDEAGGTWMPSGEFATGPAGSFDFAPIGATQSTTFHFQAVSADALGNVTTQPFGSAGVGQASTVFTPSAGVDAWRIF